MICTYTSYQCSERTAVKEKMKKLKLIKCKMWHQRKCFYPPDFLKYARGVNKGFLFVPMKL